MTRYPQHFGEHFTGVCKRECDNCTRQRLNPESIVTLKCRAQVDAVVKMVKEAKAISVNAKGLTLTTLREALLGRKNSSRASYAVDFSASPHFGCLRDFEETPTPYSQSPTTALLLQLIIHQVLLKKGYQ